MKLSKSLLSAIVVGIAVQSAVSCTKTSLKTSDKTKQTEQQKSPGTGRPIEPTTPVGTIDSCPACGMG